MKVNKRDRRAYNRVYLVGLSMNQVSITEISEKLTEEQCRVKLGPLSINGTHPLHSCIRCSLPTFSSFLHHCTAFDDDDTPGYHVPKVFSNSLMCISPFNATKAHFKNCISEAAQVLVLIPSRAVH